MVCSGNERVPISAVREPGCPPTGNLVIGLLLAQSKPQVRVRRMSEKKTSQDRTDMAEDRTAMANERTYSSWMGTGLGAIGVAIGMKAVFGDFEPTWAAKAVATLFLIIAVVIFWEARQQACKTLARLRETDFEAKSGKSFSLLATLMSLAAVLTGAILWSL